MSSELGIAVVVRGPISGYPTPLGFSTRRLRTLVPNDFPSDAPFRRSGPRPPRAETARVRVGRRIAADTGRSERKMAEIARYCACGCGAPLNGSQQQRWATDACRKHAGRAEAAGVAAAARQRAPGPVRAGLEQWLIDQPALPEVTVAAARVLADELMPTRTRARLGPLRRSSNSSRRRRCSSMRSPPSCGR